MGQPFQPEEVEVVGVVEADAADVEAVGAVVVVGVVVREVIDKTAPLRITLQLRKEKKIKHKLERRGKEQLSPTVHMMLV